MVLFPEFTQIFADPCGQTALTVLKAFPSAQAMADAGVEALFQLFRAQKPAQYGRPTARKLVALAKVMLPHFYRVKKHTEGIAES